MLFFTTMFLNIDISVTSEENVREFSVIILEGRGSQIVYVDHSLYFICYTDKCIQKIYQKVPVLYIKPK